MTALESLVHTIYNVPELVRLVGQYGLPIIIFAETGLLIGFFLPGDSLLITAGLFAARGDLDKTRDDLQGAISSTHDELSGSIAKSHEEIMALQKRGERNYYEFDLAKGKNYQRVGPLNLSLRKSNTKRKSFDMMMLVDDNQLQKKNVNLYEPVWINLSDFPQPLELVVNQIGKDTVHGYLSEPKYKKSDLDTSASLGPLKQ